MRLFPYKALYGPKRSPQIWYLTLHDFWRSLNFHKTGADYGLFVSDDKTIFIAIYIDNLLFFSVQINPWIDDVMQNLWDTFRMTDLSDVSHNFLIEVDVDFKMKTITLWQSTYLKKILGRYGMINRRLAKIFICPWVVNSLSPYKDEAGKNTIIWYQSAIAAFIRLSINFWPDLAYSVRVLSQFCRDPWLVHVKLVKNVLWYKSGTIDLGLNFEGRADTLDDGCSWLGWLWFCRVKTWSKIDWKIYLYACNGCN